MKGFTLAEVVITSAVAVIVGGLLLAIMVQNTGLFYRQTSRLQEGIGVNDALSAIKASVRQAQSVATSFTQGGGTFTSSPTELVLRMSSINSSGNIMENIFDFFVFTKSGDKLYQKIFPDSQSARKAADQILTASLEAIVFQYFDSQGIETSPDAAVKVKATVTLKKRAGTTFEVNTATAEVHLRND